MAGLIMLSASFCSRNIWQLYVFYAALGVATSGITPVSYCAIVTRWFDRYRGLALGVMMLGLGLGALIIPILAQHLTAAFGWRSSFELAGAATLVITVPAITLFLRTARSRWGLPPDGADRPITTPVESGSGSGLSWRQASHDSTFWVLFCAFIIVAAAVRDALGHVSAIVADGASARKAPLSPHRYSAAVFWRVEPGRDICSIAFLLRVSRPPSSAAQQLE